MCQGEKKQQQKTHAHTKSLYLNPVTVSLIEDSKPNFLYTPAHDDTPAYHILLQMV